MANYKAVRDCVVYGKARKAGTTFTAPPSGMGEALGLGFVIKVADGKKAKKR